jgi:hypothetical protein
VRLIDLPSYILLLRYRLHLYQSFGGRRLESVLKREYLSPFASTLEQPLQVNGPFECVSLATYAGSCEKTPLRLVFGLSRRYKTESFFGYRWVRGAFYFHENGTRTVERPCRNLGRRAFCVSNPLAIRKWGDVGIMRQRVTAIWRVEEKSSSRERPDGLQARTCRLRPDPHNYTITSSFRLPSEELTSRLTS